MKNRTLTSILALTGVVFGSVWVCAQGRGGVEWTTSHFDAQRTGSIANDPRISVATMLKPAAFGPFTFLWKLKLEHDPAASPVLTQPVLLDRIVGFRGFKSIAFVGTGSETVHAIDIDLGVPLWKYHINYSASPPPVRAYAGCPGGLTSALSRPTNTSPPAVGPGGGGGGRGGRSGGGVGEPGRGAITLATAGQARGGPPAGAPGGRGGEGGGPVQQGVVPGSAAAAAGAVPGALPAGARAGGVGGGGGRGGRGFMPGDDAAYVVGSDGYLHALNVQNGWDNMTPAMFLPANTRANGLIVATAPDGGAVAYAATTHGCGSQPDGVWAMDLASPQKTVMAFQPNRANIAGTAGPTFGRDGTIYVATTSGSAAMSNSVIALESKTLKPRTSVAVPQAGFTSSPLVFSWQGKDTIAVAGGGKVYLFDSGSLASGPVATSTPAGATNSEVGALTSWADSSGTRWIAMPAPRGIVALKVIDQGGRPSFAPGWTSRDIAAPLTPLVINGVLFAASSGTRTAPGVLYAVDATTGKDLWNSGKTITSIIQGGLSGQQGNVYVPGADGTLYTFGFAIEK